jgi:hypothetical protein
MSCERYRTAIVDYACGADIDADAATHLRMCASCLRLFEEQQRALANLDRELEQVLSIEPSPQFVPQVIARVRRPSPWRLATWWGLPLAAAAALLVIVFGPLRSGERTTTEQASVSAASSPAAPAIPSRPPDVARPPIEGAVGRPVAYEPARVTPRRPLPRAAATKVPPPSTAAEVLVPAETSRALARYVALVRRGAIDTSTLTEPPSSGAEAPSELVIAPLSVDAIAVADVERRSGPGGDERDRGLR